MRPMVAHLVLVSLVGCYEPDDFTAAELENLGELVFDAEMIRDDPTNAWADDPAAAALGKKLFFDPRFSGPILRASDLGQPGDIGRVSCSSCHDLENGGADTRSGGPTSFGTGASNRNTTTVINSGVYGELPWLVWNGAKDSQWSLATSPAENPPEHNGSRLYFVHLLNELYREEYESVFGPMPDMAAPGIPPKEGLCNENTCLGRAGDEVWATMSPEAQHDVTRVFVNFAKAISAYERLLVTPYSALDDYMRGDGNALSPAQIRGARLFVGRASCNECHRGPMLADNRFHNIGVPQLADAALGLPGRDEGRAGAMAFMVTDPFNAASEWSDDPSASGHLEDYEEGPEDLGAFRTPGLRNVAETAPYMHNGSIGTLWEVLDFYSFGGNNGPGIGQHAPAVQPLVLSDQDILDLVEFLHALSGSLPEELTTPPELP